MTSNDEHHKPTPSSEINELRSLLPEGVTSFDSTRNPDGSVVTNARSAGGAVATVSRMAPEMNLPITRDSYVVMMTGIILSTGVDINQRIIGGNGELTFEVSKKDGSRARIFVDAKGGKLRMEAIGDGVSF